MMQMRCGCEPLLLGEWLDDPEKFEEPQDSWEPNVVQALRTGLQKQRSMNNANSSPIDSVADDGSMPHFSLD